MGALAPAAECTSSQSMTDLAMLMLSVTSFPYATFYVAPSRRSGCCQPKYIVPRDDVDIAAHRYLITHTHTILPPPSNITQVSYFGYVPSKVPVPVSLLANISGLETQRRPLCKVELRHDMSNGDFELAIAQWNFSKS